MFFLSLVGLLIAYYFIFWAFMHHKPLRKLKKPYRIASFIVGCYWALFLFWVFMQTFDIDYYRRRYECSTTEAYHYFIGDMIGYTILSLICSGMVFVVMYVYQKYVNQEEA